MERRKLEALIEHLLVKPALRAAGPCPHWGQYSSGHQQLDVSELAETRTSFDLKETA